MLIIGGKEHPQYNCKTQRETESVARQALGILTAGEEQEHATLAESFEGWLKSHAEVNCHISPVTRYRSMYTLDLKPRLGALPLGEVNRERIKAFVGRRVSKASRRVPHALLLLSSMPC